jgi:hypothetical protein
MTVNDAINTALAILSSTSTASKEYVASDVIGQMNLLLMQTFDANNALFESDGLPLLLTPQTVTKLSDVLLYHWRIAGIAFPWALASFIALDEDNSAKVTYFNAMYSQALNGASVGTRFQMTDAYAGGMWDGDCE